MQERDVRSPGAALLIAVVVIYAAVLLISPIAAILAGAFKDGVDPVIRAVTAPDALAALRLSLFLALAATAINAVLGTMVAWVLVRHRFLARQVFDALIDLPFVVSPVIVGYVMIVLFGRTGWLNNFPIPLAFSWQGMLVVTVFVSLPFVIRELEPVLAALTPEQEEAAYTLGASPWLTFRRILFPAIRHALFYGIVLTLARALGEFGAVAVIGGGIEGVTETATIYIYRSLNDRNNAGAYGTAIVLGLIAVGILTIMNRLRAADKKQKDA